MVRAILGSAHLVFTRRRTALVGTFAVLSVLALGGGVYAYGYHFLRFGCPSEEEADRPRTPEEVRAAFDKNSLPLSEIARPHGLPRETHVYRHEAENATLLVFLCPGRCPGEATERAASRASGRVARRGTGFANVQLWELGPHGRSAQRLRPRVSDAVNRLAPFDERCHIR